MHSKIHQENNAYKLEIVINDTKCPVCNHYALRMNSIGVITCKCGFISDNLHEYVAGFKLNNDLNFKIIKTKPEME